MIFSFCTTVFAAETPENTNEIATIWNESIENNTLYVNDNGRLAVKNNHLYFSDYNYDNFLNLVELCNYCIDNNILELDPMTCKLYSVIQLDEKYIPYGKTNKSSSILNNSSELSPRNGAHGCSVQALDLLTMCRNNYNDIESFYDNMVIIQISNPGVDPFNSTIGYWIGKVRPNGSWDYKSLAGFKGNSFCSYYSGAFNHITAEYIGNFNYGYTGSFLFPLSVLYGGSRIVAGGIEKDLHDRTAINDGYNLAP